MKSPTTNRWRRCAILAGAAISGLGWSPRGVVATTWQWVGGTSNWNNTSNWNSSSGSGVPASNDNAYITSAIGTSQTVTYDYSVANFYIGTLELNATGTNPGQTSENFLMTANAFKASEELVGGYNNSPAGGVGTFTQTGGSNTISAYNLFLGYNAGDEGIYNLSGTGTLYSSNELEIGFRGLGIFNQTGGTNTANTGFVMGDRTASSNGTYLLSGGTLTSNGLWEYIGDSGIGVFNQSGGVHSLNGGTDLYLGYLVGSSGMYYLSATGTLTVAGGGEFVGASGNGTFNQTGGTNSIASSGYGLVVGSSTGSSGSYLLSGGTLSAFSEQIGNSGTGIFNQSGGNNNVSGIGLVVGNNSPLTSSYTLSGSGLITSVANEVVGQYGKGAFYQTGGTNTITARNYLSLGVNSGSVGTYNMTGGTLNAGFLYVGGTYGTSSPNGGGLGVLDVGPGAVINISVFLVGYNSSGSAINLQGGTINTYGMQLINPAIVHWTSGTINFTNGVEFDPASGAGSTADPFGPVLTLGAGQTLRAAGEVLGGTGSFTLTLSGGSNIVSYPLSVLAGSNLNIQSGSVSAAGLQNSGIISMGIAGILSNSGNFNQSAGGLLSLSIQGPRSYDEIQSGGSIFLGGVLALQFDPSYVPEPGDTFAIISGGSGDTIQGTFSSITQSIQYAGGYFLPEYKSPDNPVGVDLVYVAVPEPASMMLLPMVAATMLRRNKAKLCRENRSFTT